MDWFDKVTLIVLFIGLILILFGEPYAGMALSFGWLLGVIGSRLDEELK